MNDENKQYLQTLTKEAGEKGPKGIIKEAYKDEIFQSLRMKDSDNQVCYDCLNSNASWCSITYAIFLCLVCSGSHRQKGTHLSFVRSTNLDNFTYEQLTRFIIGGNKRCRAYMRTHSGNREGKLDVRTSCAKEFKEDLDADVAKILSLVPAVTATAAMSSSPTTASEPRISHPQTTPDVPLLEAAAMDTSPSNNKAPIIPQVSRNTTASSRPLMAANPSVTRKPMASVFLGSRISPSTTLNPSPRVNDAPKLSPVVSPEADRVESDYQSRSAAPTTKMPALSSADYFGYSDDKQLNNQRSEPGGVNMDELYVQSQIIADQAKDTASRIAEEGSDLVNRGLDWFRNYYG